MLVFFCLYLGAGLFNSASSFSVNRILSFQEFILPVLLWPHDLYQLFKVSE